MNGIIVIDKPKDFTSFDVVAKMRGICGIKKIGHGGTLDPMATGVLPVFIGTAAKAVDLQEQQDKTYRAAVLFGVKTDTGDITGSVLEERNVNVNLHELEEVIPEFIGVIEQLPPMYSAVKIKGKPLYKYAREGKEIERKKRKIEIFNISNCLMINKNIFQIDVHCSKGTYIRTLIEDIGERLGYPATMCELRRTTAGIFNIENTYSLDDVQKAKDEQRLESLLQGVDCVFAGMPEFYLSDDGIFRLMNGAAVYRTGMKQGRYKLYFGENKFAGIGNVKEDGSLMAEKLFIPRK